MAADTGVSMPGAEGQVPKVRWGEGVCRPQGVCPRAGVLRMGVFRFGRPPLQTHWSLRSAQAHRASWEPWNARLATEHTHALHCRPVTGGTALSAHCPSWQGPAQLQDKPPQTCPWPADTSGTTLCLPFSFHMQLEQEPAACERQMHYHASKRALGPSALSTSPSTWPACNESRTLWPLTSPRSLTSGASGGCPAGTG